MSDAQELDFPDVHGQVIKDYCRRVWSAVEAVASGQAGPTRVKLVGIHGETIEDLHICRIGDRPTIVSRRAP